MRKVRTSSTMDLLQHFFWRLEWSISVQMKNILMLWSLFWQKTWSSQRGRNQWEQGDRVLTFIMFNTYQPEDNTLPKLDLYELHFDSKAHFFYPCAQFFSCAFFVPLHIFCSLAHFLFPCTLFVPLNVFSSIFYANKNKKHINKASFRIFEQSSRSKTLIIYGKIETFRVSFLSHFLNIILHQYYS